MQGHVEEAHGPVAVFQIPLQHIHIGMPVFTHGEELPAQVPAHGFEPPDEECIADVLHRIQPDAVQLRRLEIPFAPAQQLLPDLGIGKIHVRAHEVVIVAVLTVHLLGPAAAHELVNGAGGGLLVPVHGGEMGCIPLEGGIFPLPGRELEARPGQDLLVLHQPAAAVPGITLDRPDRFQMVRAHPVVQHHICQHPKALIVEGIDGGEILLPGAVLGGNGPLLVEFAQIIEVIHAVAHIVHTGLALVGRGQPHVGDAQTRQIFRCLPGAPPVAAVGREIPFKQLDQSSVFHSRSSFSLFSYSIPERKDHCNKNQAPLGEPDGF